MGRITLINTSRPENDMNRVKFENGRIRFDADRLFYKDLNFLLRDVLKEHKPEIISIHNVYGQRYIGTNLRQNVKIEIYGTPGNDLGAFMDGPTIEVFGNAQDGCGNTMNSGEIVVHGSAGDITGFAARGGEIFVKDDVGYRVGIHMKEYQGKKPTLVIGGTAQDFLGEYMAGGTLIVFGLHLSEEKRHRADFIGTGMHGGTIYIRGKVEDHQLGKELGKVEMKDHDWALIEEYAYKYAEHFGYNHKHILNRDFVKLVPLSLRPYGKLYAY